MMKLTYKELKAFASNFNNLLDDSNGKCQIQKIFSTPHLIAMNLRMPGSSTALYLGRGGSFQGVFLYEDPPKSEFRIKDQFLEYLRKHIKNSFITSMRVDSKDRILALDYLKSGSQCTFYFFWKASSLYFINESNDEVFLSWNRRKIKKDDLDHDIFDLFDEVGRKNIELNKILGLKNDLNEYFDNFYKNFVRHKKINRKEKYFKNKIKNISQDLEKVSKWQAIESDINDPSYKFPDKKDPKLHGIKIKLEKDWEHYKKVSYCFEKLKQLKSAEKLLEKRIVETKSEYFQWVEGQSPDISEIKVLYPVWSAKNDKKLEKTSKNTTYFVYKNEVKLGLGLDSQGNDYLRNSWGKKHDWWVHIEGKTSAHCVVKITATHILTIELLALIGSMLRDRSHYEFEEIPLVFTQVKNLKGLKGKSGGVLLKNAKNLRVYYNQLWEKELINNNL